MMRQPFPIRKLEHELNVPLVQRGRTFHGLTPRVIELSWRRPMIGRQV
jgi:hypothetical protein